MAAKSLAPPFAVLIAISFSIPSNAQQLDIIHINVGQGDSTLILGPDDATGRRISVLMDAGDRGAGNTVDGGAVVGALLGEMGIRQLDAFIASHYDADHIGGVITGQINVHGHSFLLGRNGVPGAIGDDDSDGTEDWLEAGMIHPDPDEIGQDDDVSVAMFVDYGDIEANSQTAQKYIGMATSMGIRRTIDSQAGVNSFEIDLGGGATMMAVAANGFVRDRTARVASVNTPNERSLAFVVRFGGFDYLVGGDLIGQAHGSENARVEFAVGEYLRDAGINLDILHANHHGANNGSEADFLALAQPEVAIISTGDGNPHGHPHPDALARLGLHVRKIYQTNWGVTDPPNEIRRLQTVARGGNVVISTDGRSYAVKIEDRYSVDN